MSDESKVVIYGNKTCGYCMAARMLLKKKGVNYENIIVSRHPSALEEMKNRSGRQTVPQIFVGDKHVGGFEELSALEASGELDQLLADQ